MTEAPPRPLGRALRFAATAALGAVALVSLAGAVQAAVPAADRIARATAKANKASSRSQALQLDITLRVADREPIGTGKLVTHPSGLGRLELRDAAGRVERHLRVATDHTASRNGEELDEPRAFLPPLSFLQVDSSDTLRQALTDYGLDAGAAALAPCGESICFVIGDAARVAPPPPTERELARMKAAAKKAGVELVVPKPETASGDGDEARDAASAPRPGLWVDSRSFDIVRMDGLGGGSVEFGPVVDFEGVRFPGSITIHEPEREPVRLDILGITVVNAPAASFRRNWLLAPPDDPQDPASPGPLAP